MMRNYAEWVLRYRLWIIAATVVISALMVSFCASLRVIINPNETLPEDNVYVQGTRTIVDTFGSEYPILIGVTPKQGDIFQPAVLNKVKQITGALSQTSGVVKTSLLSLSADTVKNIKGSVEGFDVQPLLPVDASNDFYRQPSKQQLAELKQALLDNPIYLNSIVSKNFQTAAIWVEVEENSAGFNAMIQPVMNIVEAAQNTDSEQELTIAVAGNPVYLAKSEQLAERMVVLFPLAFLIIGLLHLEAFRTKQGFIVPLVTAALAALWGTGLMGLMNRPLDAFNSPTPILILGVAAGHAVQLLKRYYEEYAALRSDDAGLDLQGLELQGLDPKAANREAVIRSIAGVGPVTAIAGVIAALGFFSLLTFDIGTIRTFGLFTGCGILCAVVLELTFIPAVRSLLPPPSDAECRRESQTRVWDRIPAMIAAQITCPAKRRRLFVVLMLLWGIALACCTQVVVDNSNRSLFASWLKVREDDDWLNQQTAGTNALYIMVDGQQADAMKAPKLLNGIATLQAFIAGQPHVGKTLSIADFVQRMNKAMHGDDPDFDKLAQSRDLISQYLLLYSLSGAPEDFDAYIDYDYQSAKIVVLLKTGSNAYIGELIDKINVQANNIFGDNATLIYGGDTVATLALTDTLVQGKLLNIVQICLAIFAISSLVFRSLWAGIIVLMPLLLAATAEFAIMGITGIPLNIPNSLIAAMAVGIGADYAIYMLYRLREQMALGHSAEVAVRNTLATAGKACLMVATAVASGYGVAVFSIGYNVHLWFAIFTATMMLVSALGSLIMVPGMVLMCRPAFVMNSSSHNASSSQSKLFILAMVLLAALAYALPLIAQAEENTTTDTVVNLEDLTAQQIMAKSRAATRVQDIRETATFTLTNKKGHQRIRTAESYSKLQDNGDDYQHMVRFLSPSDIKGTATLLIEHSQQPDDMWVYLPALKKVRRLSGNNKKDSFIGTDFSYGDVLGYSLHEWQYQQQAGETINGVNYFVIDATPASDHVRQEHSVSKRRIWVNQQSLVAEQQEFWDLSGQLSKRIKARDFVQVADGLWQPQTLKAENLLSGHSTLIKFTDLSVNSDLSDRYFNPRALER